MIGGGIRRRGSQRVGWLELLDLTDDEQAAQRRRVQRMMNVQVYLTIKRTFDFIVALLLLILLSPLFLIIALAIKLDSPGPVIFVSPRAGKNGKPFPFFKFRSMYYGVNHLAAHQEFVKQYLNGNNESGASDHRGQHIFKPAVIKQGVTPVGRILRKTSLDELPQLINVLRGEMSLVGPRPPMPYELAYYKEWHMRRLDVTPGLTSLAQINGRSSLPFDRSAGLDIEYLENRTFWLDLRILMATVPVILTMRDAG